MKITLSPLAEMGLRTMTDDNRQMVSAWLEDLAKWDEDSSLRQLAQKLPSKPDTFFLKMNNKLRLIFRVAGEQIEVQDFLSRDLILAFAPIDTTQVNPLSAGAGK